LPEDIQDEILALSKLLSVFGPSLKRPHADTLNGSSYANMKELRFEAGDKSGVNQKRFYKMLIAKADTRFSDHLAQRTKTKEGTR
jgi:hypothetical protein